jgi:AcrR family transcriptional regulator
MGWDTDETRRRLKQAATEEFAAHGMHGTTMDRIAARAGINKERLYNYFGRKEQLFATVLSDQLAEVAAAVPLESLREQDVGEFAGHVFDYHAANPRLTRLMLWEGLAVGNDDVEDEPARTAYYQQKVQAVAEAQGDGLLVDEPGAAHLMVMILGIAAWWFAVPQIARMLTGSRGDVDEEHAVRRAAVVRAARRMAGGRASSGESLELDALEPRAG